MPEGSMLGCAAKRLLLSFIALKLTAWADSLAGPAEMLVAQPETVCCAEPSTTV